MLVTWPASARRLATTLPQIGDHAVRSERQPWPPCARRDGSCSAGKGAVERMLDLCGTEMGADGAYGHWTRATVLRATEMLTSGCGCSSRMSASAGTPGSTENVIPGSLALTGLQAMSDHHERPRHRRWRPATSGIG